MFSGVYGLVKCEVGVIEGSLEVILVVNWVLVSGDEKKVGRVIIG